MLKAIENLVSVPYWGSSFLYRVATKALLCTAGLFPSPIGEVVSYMVLIMTITIDEVVSVPYRGSSFLYRGTQ